MNSLITLVRREFWEHRALWLVPLIVAAAAILLTAIGGSISTRGVVHMSIDVDGTDQPVQQLDAERRAGLQTYMNLSPQKKQTLYLITLLAFVGLEMLAIGIVVFFYLLDSLYSERKDRSILFWKSMPISDTSTVLAKLLVGLVLAPLIALLLGTVTQLAFSGIAALKFSSLTPGNFPPIWDAAVWLKAQGLMLVTFVVAVLWYSPIASYLLLVSAWARRNVFLWAVLPPVILAFGERALFGSSYISAFIGRRFMDVWGMFSFEASLGAGKGDAAAAAVLPLDRALQGINTTGFLLSPSLWLGLAAAALLLFGAIRIRRYRDDT
ncbi:MAG: hypothetical protein KDI32_04830 [Pseudomonadales bacterium]|nr:hypothetical protein [Pseudomonadales bacterium]